LHLIQDEWRQHRSVDDFNEMAIDKEQIRMAVIRNGGE